MIDDNPAIHEDYRKILTGRDEARMSAAEAALFGEQQPRASAPDIRCGFRDAGTRGRGAARAALSPRDALTPSPSSTCACRPAGMGWRRSKTSGRVDPEIQVVICSAYTDYDWLELLARLGHSDKLIVIKKPFEPIEILQSASALSRKWQNARALKRHVEGLELVVTDRTSGLEAANRQLRHLASHDALTGLPNRLLLDDRMTQAIAQANRQSHEFAVLVWTSTASSSSTTRSGHRAGDELLREVALRLKGAVRAVDTHRAPRGRRVRDRLRRAGDADRGAGDRQAR